MTETYDRTRDGLNARCMCISELPAPNAKKSDGKSNNTRVAAMREDKARMDGTAAHAISEAQQAPAGYRRTEVGVIPKDWCMPTVRDLFHYQRTASNSRDDLDNSGPIAYVHYGDIHTRFKHFIDFTREDVPRLSASLKVSATRLRDGDLIVADASEDEEGVGKSTEVRNLGSTSAVSGLHTILLRARDQRVSSGFRAYLLENVLVKKQIHRVATGLKVFGISKHALGNILVPIPETPEQRAIAKVLLDVNRLLESLDTLITKKQAIKLAAMQQLLTGKIRLPGFDGAWGTKRIGDVSDVDPENLKSSTNPAFTFNYISLEQVDAGRLLGYSEERFRTAPSRARRVLRYGDVLMSTVRPNLMAHLLYREQIPNAVCSTGFAVLRARPQLSDPGFLFAHLLGSVVNKQIDKTLAGSNYPAINGRDVRLIGIPCPHQITEQRAIAAVLSDMDVETAVLEQRVDKTRALKQGMMQELLTGRTRLFAPGAAP